MTGKMKWVIGILGLSLALNVFALGLFIGKGARNVVPHKERMAPPPHPVEFNFKRLEQNLTEEDREKVRALLRDKRRDLRRKYGALRNAEQKIKALVLSETVDKEALKAALEKHSELAQGMLEPMRWVVLETIASLDLESRKKVVDEMFEGSIRKRFRRGLPPHRRPPPGDRRRPPRDCVDCETSS